MLRESIGLPVGDVPLASEVLEVEVEDLFELAVPVVDETRRHDHQRPPKLAPSRKVPQDQRRLDGLSEPDLIRDQRATRRPGGDTVGEHDLMRQQIDAS
ncbi:MAG: hypothetical protein AMXMBFR64_44650 [Myxococcales bacterium]